MEISWQPLFLTFKLAAVTTAILLLVGIPVAYWLAYSRSRWKYIAETFVSMPLVLPPSVLGFYLLVAFSPQQWFGRMLKENFNLQFVFSFEGLVLGSLIFSLPFMVHPIQAGLEGLPLTLREASYTLGKSKLQTLLRVLIPNIKPSLLSGLILTFAHTIGEFGVVLMIGGSIPGETKVASIAIYEEVETLNYTAAHQYAFILFGITFAILLMVYVVNRNFLKKW